jgi:PadR family transcriptional regulator PadR
LHDKTKEIIGMETDIGPFETEMNRGFLQVLVLVLLERDMYGYAMVKEMEGKKYALEENTLYPLLRRLEKKGLVESKWDITEDRPRKFYVITKNGRKVRAGLLKMWQQQNAIMNRLLKENQNV